MNINKTDVLSGEYMLKGRKVGHRVWKLYHDIIKGRQASYTEGLYGPLVNLRDIGIGCRDCRYCVSEQSKQRDKTYLEPTETTMYCMYEVEAFHKGEECSADLGDVVYDPTNPSTNQRAAPGVIGCSDIVLDFKNCPESPYSGFQLF